MNDKEISVLREEIEGLKRDAAMMMEAAEGVSLDPRHINKLEALDKALSKTPDSAAWLEKKIEERVGPLREDIGIVLRWTDRKTLTMNQKVNVAKAKDRLEKVLSTEDSEGKKS